MKADPIVVPAHPGKNLETALKDRAISQSELARQSGISFQRINGIICGRRSITVDSALRIEAATGYSPILLLAMQNAFDLYQARKRLTPALKKIKPIIEVSG